MQTRKFDAELLRPLEHIGDADPRNPGFTVFDRVRGIRSKELADHHAAIAEIVLDEEVPREIRIAFDTVRNLYLYSWFVYRFFPIAEHQAFVCLELALRSRFANERPKRLNKRGREIRPSLREWLRFAVDGGHLRNEGFKRWHEIAERRARSRYDMEQLREMIERNLTSQEVDYSKATVTDGDRDFSYLSTLVEGFTLRRNSYAHGSHSLHNQVRGTIELVAEMINQIHVRRSK